MKICSWDCRWCIVYACFVDKSHILSVYKIFRCAEMVLNECQRWKFVIKTFEINWKCILKMITRRNENYSHDIFPLCSLRVSYSNRLNLCMWFEILVNTMQQRIVTTGKFNNLNSVDVYLFYVELHFNYVSDENKFSYDVHSESVQWLLAFVFKYF